MKKIKAVIFDFDNTVIHMPTKIKLFHSTKKDYINLSTSKFAKFKKMIGKEGILKHCSIDSKSFEEFSTPFNKNSFFIEDIVELINSENKEVWKAHYFNYFLEMLSNHEDSQNVYILTARNHDSEEFMSGLRVLQNFLQKNDKKIFLPRKEHMFFVGGQENIAQAKSDIISKIVLKESKESTTEIEFADDDEDNVHKVEYLINSIKDSFKEISFTVTHVLDSSVSKKVFNLK